MFKISNNFNILRIFFLFIISFTFFFVTSPFVHAEMISIKGDKVNLRKGPSTKYGILWEYGDGYPLQVVEKQGNWLKVKDFEQDTGWIHKSLLQYSPHVIVKVNRNNSSKINIRKGPGLSSDIIGKAQYGVVFKTIKRKTGWINVEHESGVNGWVKESLLWGY